jgi:hypothetical protein
MPPFEGLKFLSLGRGRTGLDGTSDHIEVLKLDVLIF